MTSAWYTCVVSLPYLTMAKVLFDSVTVRCRIHSGYRTMRCTHTLGCVCV